MISRWISSSTYTMRRARYRLITRSCAKLCKHVVDLHIFFSLIITPKIPRSVFPSWQILGAGNRHGRSTINRKRIVIHTGKKRWKSIVINDTRPPLLSASRDALNETRILIEVNEEHSCFRVFFFETERTTRSNDFSRAASRDTGYSTGINFQPPETALFRSFEKPFVYTSVLSNSRESLEIFERFVNWIAANVHCRLSFSCA